METVVDPDLPWLTDEGLKTLQRGYLLEGETPLNMYQRVAKAAALRLRKPEMERYFLEAMMKNWLCLASPVAANMGTTRGFPISCFGLTVEDSVFGIYTSVREFAMLSKMGGGVGVNMSEVRGRGTPITANGVSEGVIPWIKQFDAAVIAVNQGQTRRGAGSMNLNIEHIDAEEFMMMRRPVGDVNRQCLNLNHCVQIGDEFMDSLERGSPVARRLWGETLRTRLETGEPYIMFQDTTNDSNPDAYKRNNLKVTMTNICSEISLFSDPFHTFVCCLSSLNLARWDEWKDYTFGNHMTLPELATWFLDGVMQEFIDRADRYPGFENAVRFAKKSRALGLGVLGWHTLLQSKFLPFDTSIQVMALNSQIFKFMQYETNKASVMLALEYGEPDWCHSLQRRNTHLMALAPTFSNSLISGNLSKSVEPIVGNTYNEKTAKGTFVMRNPAFASYLDSIGQNKPEVWKSVVAEEGSVQHLDFLSPEAKAVFLTAREMNQLNVIRQAGQRQAFIDQSQSINLFFPKNVDPKWFHQLHMEAWKQGLKSLYYIRSVSALKGDVASRAFVDDCAACEG